MKYTFLLSVLVALFLSFSSAPAALGDSSHARIVRLSFLQGDVRFVREFRENSITDPNAVWEVAQLNLPIRQGNALSTGNGRAEVEFENGAMAFLGANTVVEFYDLSLNDGSRITRLILRQGSASFHDRSQSTDYFSVTGGDFTVAADGRATFRLENFDDGSSLSVLGGHVQVLQNEKSIPLDKGQSFAVRTEDPERPTIAHAVPSDDFDRWVSSRIQDQDVVNSEAESYTSSNNSYVAGYSDLYTYGSWLSVGGLNCWRPFGAGLGWSPFDYGNWYYDQGGFGWSFLGTSPWGWLPYHYGGWIFSPSYGWLWNPGGLPIGRPQPYHPVTAVFVRSGNTLAVVPMHPGDKPGRTPLNLSQGVYPVQGGVIAKSMTAANGEKWVAQKNAQGAGFSSTLVAANAPSRVIRSMAVPGSSGRETSLARTSTIAYDAAEHRFVNSNAVSSKQGKPSESTAVGGEHRAGGSGTAQIVSNKTNITPIGVLPGARSATPTVAPRATPLPPRPSVAPAPAHTAGGGSSAPAWGGSGSSSAVATSPSASSTATSSRSSTGGGRVH
jgi:hypothetical protein